MWSIRVVPRTRSERWPTRTLGLNRIWKKSLACPHSNFGGPSPQKGGGRRRQRAAYVAPLGFKGDMSEGPFGTHPGVKPRILQSPSNYIYIPTPSGSMGTTQGMTGSQVGKRARCWGFPPKQNTLLFSAAGGPPFPCRMNARHGYRSGPSFKMDPA